MSTDERTGLRGRVRERGLAAGVSLGAGVAAVGGSYAAAGRSPGFVAAPLAGFVTAVTPDAVVSWAIVNLGSLGQQLVYLAGIGLAVVLLGLLAHAGYQTARATGSRVLGWLLAAAGVALAAGVLTGAVVPSLAAGVGAASVVALGAPTADAWGPSPTARRNALKASAGALAFAGAGAVLGRSGGDADGDGPTATEQAMLDAAEERALDDLGSASRLVSTGRGHYEVDINSVNPRVEGYQLTVTGAVSEETAFTLEDLRAMPAEHRFSTLRCVGEGLNGHKMDTALWTGVPASAVLDRADVPPECCVMLRAADGYYEEFPLSALREGLFAYRMNGQPLPRAHGRPVRVLVPGHWGEINVKWVTVAEVLEREQTGYWEERGWHGTGPVHTVAKLHHVATPGAGRVVVGGHAYAGTRGVQRVEVSTDGGETWTAAELSGRLPASIPADGSFDPANPGEAADAWRQWRHEYTADRRHEVVVRAVDGTGTVQPGEDRQPFPSGPTGWVSREVDPRG